MKKLNKNRLPYKILLTVLLLAIYKAVSLIPVPFVDTAALSIFSSISLFAAVNDFNGGTLSQLSFTAVGISSYVTASIIVQLLSVGLKPMEDISKMPGGQKVIKKITIWLGIFISLVMSLGLTTIMGTQTSFLTTSAWYAKLVIALCHCLGSAFAIYVGETITEKGFGNGVSLLIAINIATSLPKYITQSISLGKYLFAIAGATMFIVLFCIVILETSEVRVPVQYSKTIYSGTVPQTPFLPIKVNIAGVMPIIFASTIYQIIGLVVELTNANLPDWADNMLTYGTVPYMLGTVAIVFVFTFFYSALIFRTDEISKGLQNNEGCIQGIRPGSDTERYLTKLMYKLNLIGATYMSVLVLIPMIMFNAIGYSGIQPTSMIILAGVGLEIIGKIQVEYQATACLKCKQSVLLKTARQASPPV